MQAREILDGMDKTIEGLKAKDSAAFESAGKLLGVMSKFDVQEASHEESKKSLDNMKQAIDGKDFEKLSAAVKTLQGQIAAKFEAARKYDSEKEKLARLFGTDKSAAERVESWGKKESEKPKETEKLKGLPDHAKDTISKLEQTAQIGKSVANKDPGAERKLFNMAKDAIRHLRGQTGMPPLDALLDKVEIAIDKEDADAVRDGMFSYKGVKNFMHVYLRELKQRGEKDDTYFGNVDDALQEFERLGQI